MARSEARLYTEIWEDKDFIALSPMAQRAFMFLISQPDLAHTGVIPLRIKRWARKGLGLTAADWERDLKDLEVARFVVADHDAEELLVRSLMRRDRIFKQPNVMRAAIDHVMLIESQAILRRLAAEVDRIQSENPDLTKQQADALAEMEKTLRERVDPETEASSERPPTNPTDKGYGKGSAIHSGNPTPEVPGERGVVQVVTTDSPFPVPRSPDPAPAVASLPWGDAPTESAPPPKSKRGARIPEGFEVTAAMATWARQKVPLVDFEWHTTKFINYWQAKTRDATKLDWVKTWQNWMLDEQAKAQRYQARASPAAAESTAPKRIPRDQQCPRHNDQRAETCRHCAALRKAGDT